jgi:hypothetical protein
MAELLKGGMYNGLFTLNIIKINLGFPGIPDPDCHYTVVDVRDTAITHYKALLNENANGNRFISAGG